MSYVNDMYAAWEKKIAPYEAVWAGMIAATSIPTYREMLAELTARGYKVRFRHYRYPSLSVVMDGVGFVAVSSILRPYSRKYGFHDVPALQLDKWGGERFFQDGVTPYARGGKTLLYVSKGNESMPIAVTCSKDDNFCYKTGREQALRRAYEKLCLTKS